MATKVCRIKSTSEQNNEKEVDIGMPLDRSNLGSKKKLLVIPLRGMIVHRVHLSRPATIPRNRPPDFCYGDFRVYKRPYCEEFLKFCFERFHVGLWSSSREKNLQGILTNVIGDLKNKFLFTWDQQHCTKTGFMCPGNQDRPLFLKELDHIWQKKYKKSPWRKGEYSASNTLLVTYPEKALLNPPNTAIFPLDYDPENKEDDHLGPKGELRVFLEGLAEAEDVQTYVQDHPINGEPEILPSHPHWDYYRKIICSCNKKKTGKEEAKKEGNQVVAAKKDAKQKVKIEEPEKDKKADEDDSTFEDSDEGNDSEEDEETPKKQQSGKKRPNESAINSPNEKKAKLSTPHKIDGKIAGGAFSCKSCNRNFKSDMALRMHNQAKHK